MTGRRITKRFKGSFSFSLTVNLRKCRKSRLHLESWLGWNRCSESAANSQWPGYANTPDGHQGQNYETEQFSQKLSVTDESDRHAVLQGRDGGPFPGALLPCAVPDLWQQVFAISILELENTGCDFNQEWVQLCLIPFLKGLCARHERKQCERNQDYTGDTPLTDSSFSPVNTDGCSQPAQHLKLTGSSPRHLNTSPTSWVLCWEAAASDCSLFLLVFWSPDCASLSRVYPHLAWVSVQSLSPSVDPESGLIHPFTFLYNNHHELAFYNQSLLSVFSRSMRARTWVFSTNIFPT